MTDDHIRILLGKKTVRAFKRLLAIIPESRERRPMINTRDMKKGAYRFCVTAYDIAGNASRESCARLALR